MAGVPEIWSEHLKDRFEVTGLLGTGTYSKVYSAKERATGRPIALKILKREYLQDREILERFRREVFAVAAISSPHVVKLYDFGISGRDFYIAMEPIFGCDLRAVIGERAWTARDIHVVVAQIAEALTAAHKRKIVHRDLKPENVMLASIEQGGSARRVKVLDFGFAKLGEMESALELSRLTKLGSCFGTPQYMAPEQIVGEPVSRSMDIFALGVIVYEMCAGAPPWDGPEPGAVMKAVVESPLPPLENVRSGAHLALGRTEALSKFLNRALAKDPEKRPPDMQTFLEKLEVALFERRPVGGSSPSVLEETIEVAPSRIVHMSDTIPDGRRSGVPVDTIPDRRAPAADTSPELDAIDDSPVIDAPRTAQIVLPKTGGEGALWVVLLGAAFVLTVVGLWFFNR